LDLHIFGNIKCISHVLILIFGFVLQGDFLHCASPKSFKCKKVARLGVSRTIYISWPRFFHTTKFLGGPNVKNTLYKKIIKALVCARN